MMFDCLKTNILGDWHVFLCWYRWQHYCRLNLYEDDSSVKFCKGGVHPPSILLALKNHNIEIVSYCHNLYWNHERTILYLEKIIFIYQDSILRPWFWQIYRVQEYALTFLAFSQPKLARSQFAIKHIAYI